MAKYTLEDKLKAVKSVLELGMSSRAVAKSLQTAKAVVERWVARYERNGEEGLSMKSGTYTGEFKVHVVEYIRENNMSFFQGAAHFGIPGDCTVGVWDRIYEEEGPEALYRNNRGRKVNMPKEKGPDMEKPIDEDLLAEVQRLRMENEYLKKLIALVQARKKSAKKTK